MIQKQISDELVGLQEDIASQFTQDHFPLSGETYWTMVECIAIAKLAEIRGEVTF